MNTQKQTTVGFGGKNGSVVFLALFRLALLVGPETLVVKTLSHSPVICALVGIGILSLWLSVDIWPFRPAAVAAATPAPAAPAARPVTKPTMAAYAQNMTKAQWWSQMFCRVAIVWAMFHSKLTV